MSQCLMEQDDWWRRTKYFLFVGTLCLFLGIVDGLRSYAGTYVNGSFDSLFFEIVRWDVTGWLIWIFFIPLVLRLCTRIQINRTNWQKSLPIYLSIGIAVALLRTIFPALIHVLFFEGFASLQTWLPEKFYILITDVLVAFSFYALVVAFGQARSYQRQYQEEELRATQLKAQLSDAQLLALRAQLQPHFLFNVLNSISALQHEDSEKAQEMIVRLGDFLRMTLDNNGTQLVSLDREIELLKCYLAIEEMRFGQSLSTNFQISPETLDFNVPSLLLQPIVENSIKHGITPGKGKGRIDIRTRTLKDKVEIEIVDNGIGEVEETTFSEGIGFSNTRSRLEKLFGDRASLYVGNNHPNGVIVRLSMPSQDSATVGQI